MSLSLMRAVPVLGLVGLLLTGLSGMPAPAQADVLCQLLAAPRSNQALALHEDRAPAADWQLRLREWLRQPIQDPAGFERQPRYAISALPYRSERR